MKYRFVGHPLLMTLALIVGLGANAAEKRVALVIGNADYEHTARLKNPLSDASDIGAALQRLHFDVLLGTNMKLTDMIGLVRKFGREAQNADIAVVYYSGHGIQVAGKNYLIPVDAAVDRTDSLAYETVAVDQITDEMNTTRTLRLVMLDACRSNPFAASFRRASGSLSRGGPDEMGLAAPRLDEANTLVAYATRSGAIADDGVSRNSPFAQALLTYIEKPNLEISYLFRYVRDDVLRSTHRAQEPETYSSLGAAPVYLKISDQTADAPPVPLPAPAPVPGPGGKVQKPDPNDALSSMDDFYKAIRNARKGSSPQ